MGAEIDARSNIVASIRSWSRPSDLASFAAARHGFGNSDGGFGVTYPGDFDEYDLAAGIVPIPDGFVEVYGYWGPPEGYSLMIRESVYLDILAEFLAAEGLDSEAARIATVRATAQDA